MDELSAKCLLYADDQVLLVPSACELQAMVTKMNDFVKKISMKKYRKEMNAGKKVNGTLLAIMNSKSVSQQAHLAIHDRILNHTLKNGNESWIWQKKNEIGINAVEMPWLRSMCGVSRKDRCRNSDVRERCGSKEDVVTRVERGRPKEVITPEIVDKIHEMILDDRRMKVRELAHAVGEHGSITTRQRPRNNRNSGFLGVNVDQRRPNRVCQPTRFDVDLKQKRPHLAKKVLFHQDNARVHLFSHDGQNPRIEIRTATPSSIFSRFSPCDYYLFPNLKKWLGGKRFESNEEVINETNAYFESLEKTYYLEGIKKLEKRWTKCIELKAVSSEERVRLAYATLDQVEVPPSNVFVDPHSVTSAVSAYAAYTSQLRVARHELAITCDPNN
ncbi:Mariner Mos1 transposase [Eumeta japonica]|uniref:Mariner Mos1 transposase n=1 Tax=Eumeta variegata TaxID=151549 RepID=A0A4C1YI45_EUMVA|nr:Mariner Mos1 transposase [Eumeta japonica]